MTGPSEVEALHARIDRLEELLAYQLAAPALQRLSMNQSIVADGPAAERMARGIVASVRQTISSREAPNDRSD